VPYVMCDIAYIKEKILELPYILKLQQSTIKTCFKMPIDFHMYFSIPDEIPLLQRVQTIKILGVTFTSSLTVTLYAQSVIAACAQCTALYLWCYHHRKALVCIQCLMGILQCQQ